MLHCRSEAWTRLQDTPQVLAVDEVRGVARVRMPWWRGGVVAWWRGGVVANNIREVRVR